MRLQQVTKVQDRRLVGHSALASVQARKAPQGGHVVQRVLHGGVRIAIPMLQKMNPQHHTQRIRLPAVPHFGIMRLNQRLQPTPRNYTRHLRQKNLPARHLALLAITIDLGKTSLHPTGPPNPENHREGRAVQDLFRDSVAPPAHAVVLSVDEKSKVQALDLTREPSNGPRTRTKSSPPSGAGTERWIRSTSCIHDPAGCSSIAREIAGGRRGRRGCGASVPPLRHALGRHHGADTVGRAGVSGCWWGAAPGFLFAATPALSSAAPRMAVCTASCGSPLRCRAVGSGSG